MVRWSDLSGKLLKRLIFYFNLKVSPNTGLKKVHNTFFDLIYSIQQSFAIHLQEVRSCIINLTSCSRVASINASDVKDSIVIASKPSGSSLLTSFHHCIVLTESSQLRIHNCTDVRFFISPATCVILEDSRDIVFSPLLILDQISSLGMAHPDADIDDFNLNIKDLNWLKIGQSPNWKITLQAPSIPSWEELLGSLPVRPVTEWEFTSDNSTPPVFISEGLSHLQITLLESLLNQS